MKTLDAYPKAVLVRFLEARFRDTVRLLHQLDQIEQRYRLEHQSERMEEIAGELAWRRARRVVRHSTTSGRKARKLRKEADRLLKQFRRPF